MIDVESDKISCLPDHLIDQILSYLSIKEAVRTSVLSSKWRKKWSTQPNLVFDWRCVSTVTSQDPLVIESKLLRIIDHVLLLHSGPINKFKVFFDLTSGVNSMADIDRWILYISGRHIKKLVLDIRLEEHYKIPWCLFSCQSLHHLKLNYCWLKPPTTFEGFRNLKSLSMNQVTMARDSFENMISGSPLLEKLSLTDIDGLRLKPPATFEIEGLRNLKSLSMTGVTMTQGAFEKMISGCPLLEKLSLTTIDGLTQINIRAPNLKFFDIYDEFESINFDNTFQLVMVSVYLISKSNQIGLHGCSSNLLKFFVHLPHIRNLDIGYNFLKYLAAGIVPVKLPTPCINLRYLCLRINFNDWKQISVVLCLLNSSPNLRKLEMITDEESDLLTPVANCWEDIFSEPSINLGVQHVEIRRIFGAKFELDFIKFLLLYSPMLEKMIVTPVANIRTEVITELLRFKRASREAEVIYRGK